MDLIIDIGSAKIGYVLLDSNGNTVAVKNEPSVVLQEKINIKINYLSGGNNALEDYQKIRVGEYSTVSKLEGEISVNDKIIECGIIKDFSAVRFFILEICSSLKIKNSDVTVWALVTQAMDPGQRENTEKLFRSIGFKRIYVLDQIFPLTIMHQNGLFIDIGKDKTEIAVVYNNELVSGLVANVGIKSFAEEFVLYCKNRYGLFVSNKEALRAVTSINSVVFDNNKDRNDPENRSVKITVSHTEENRSFIKEFTSEDLNMVIGRQIEKLNVIICRLLAMMDKNVTEKVKSYVLCYGGAFVVFGLNYMLRDFLGIKINLANNYKNYSMFIMANVLKENREALIKKLLGE